MTTEPVQVKLQFVLEKYGIKPRENFKFSYFSMANEAFFLTDKKNRRYVLKNCLKNRSRELLDVEARLCAHLNATGCGAPVVAPALDGSRVVEYNGDFWMMYEHLAGSSPTWSQRLRMWHLRGAIQGLAKYHKAVSTLAADVDTGRIRSFDYDRIREWTEDLARQLDEDTSGRASVEKMRPLVETYRGLAKRLPELYPWDKVQHAEQLMIHGDFHAFNIMYRWHRFSSCYDFDFIRRDVKLADVIWTMRFVQNNRYYRKYGDTMWKPGFEPDLKTVLEVESEALKFVVTEYNRVYRLTKEEIALLPGMRYSLALYNLRFFALTNSEEECLEHFGWFDWQAKMLLRTDETFQRAVDAVLKDGP